MTKLENGLSSFDGNKIIALVGSLVWVSRKQPNNVKDMKKSIKLIRQQLTILEKDIE